MKIDKRLAFQPLTFPYLSRLAVLKETRDGGGHATRVEATLARNVDLDGDVLQVVFVDVSELQVGDLNSSAACRLVVYDISDHQLEGIRYRAVDEEGRSLALNCRDFEFSTVPDPRGGV